MFYSLKLWAENHDFICATESQIQIVQLKILSWTYDLSCAAGSQAQVVQLKIRVMQMTASDHVRVVLEDVVSSLSGSYLCEVTVTPTFFALAEAANMTVIGEGRMVGRLYLGGRGLKICLFLVTANNSLMLRTGRACQGTGPWPSLQMDFQPNMKYTKTPWTSEKLVCIKNVQVER